MTSKTKQIRVLIADDNRVVRRGLRLQLEQVPGILVIGEAGNGADAVVAARTERADVVLMDVQMPGMNGIDATRELVASGHGRAIPVIMMTNYAFDSYVVKALDAGAVGYLIKSYDSARLLDAIRAAAHGEAFVSPHVTAPMLREFVQRAQRSPVSAAAAQLTAAERRVVSALSSGITSNEDIAKRLHVSVHTVRSQLQTALKKVGLADRTQLALWGVRNSVVDDGS